MIESKLSTGETLIVSSEYDSGAHLGFKVGVYDGHWSDYEPLNKVLSKDQIKGLEATILATTEMYIRDNKETA